MELHEILLKWFQTFKFHSKHSKISDLSDGVAIAEALSEIAPEWFTLDWLACRIKRDTVTNWRLKVSNLKKILEKLVDYYQECFNQNLSGVLMPDVMKIGEEADPVETGRLLQLVLGCAVICENKQEYIGRIMMMEESDQRAIMECIQELDSGSAMSLSASLSLEPQVEPQLEQLAAQLNAANLAIEQVSQRCIELDQQVTILQEEKSAILEEKKRLKEQIQTSLEAGSGTIRKQVDALKEELFKLETSRDDYRLKLELQEKEMFELQIRVEELQRSAAEARQLKDEVDILRETADKVEKYEATLQSYKKKLEESGDMKRELKLLEEKNLSYIQQNMELEEEVKKNGVWKAQVDIYKKQTSELHEKLNEEIKRADKLQYEVKTMQDKLSSVLREKERLTVERDSLREANEELKCLQLSGAGDQQVSAAPPPLPTGGPDSVPDGLVLSTTELRQRIVRLQHENNMLKLAQKHPENNADSLSVVQSLLDDANKQIDKMWKDNREANQRIIHLEAELREISERGEEGAVSARTRVLELQQQVHREKQRHQAEMEEKEATLADNKQVIGLMQEKINQKELELQEADDKYRKCLEKAKSVVKAMDPSLNVNNHEVSLLRSQLVQCQKELKELQKETEERRRLHEVEGTMITTAFHNLAQVKHRESVDQRLASLGNGGSFLNRQRQPTSRKLNAYNSK